MKNIFIILVYVILATNAAAQSNPRVIISEIMYDSPLNERIAANMAYSNGEYIELYNFDKQKVDLTGWTLKGGGKTEIFKFPAGGTILPEDYKIVAYQHYDTPLVLFYDLYPDAPERGAFSQTYYQRKIILSNKGESIYLIDNNGLVRDSIDYDGTSNRSKPNRLSAENPDSLDCMLCVSLQRVKATFNDKGCAIPNNSEWVTDRVTPFEANKSWTQNYESSVSEKNYIHEYTFTAEAGIKHTKCTQYFNGLGYIEQVLDIDATPEHNNLISLTEYDMSKRESKKWQPVEVQNSNYSQPRAIKNTAVQSYEDATPFAETVYECDASDRVNTQYNVGEIYRLKDKNISHIYDGNTEDISGEDDIIKISCSLSDTTFIVHPGCYGMGSLLKETIINEDGTLKEIFSDFNSRPVVIRIKRKEGVVDTHYVYDKCGRVRLVISPEGSAKLVRDTKIYPSSELVRQFGYFYRYDLFGNLVEKQLPGKAPEYSIYFDGNLILWQDGELRKSKQWIHTLYDGLMRPFEQSLIQSDYTPEMILHGLMFPEKQIPEYHHPKYRYRFIDKYFSGHVILSSTKHQGWTYYAGKDPQTRDNIYLKFIIPEYLKFIPIDNIVTSSDVATIWGTKMYEKKAILNDSISTSYVERAFFYDKKGRVIQTVEKNHLGGINRISSKYDFTGNIMAIVETVQVPGMDAITKETQYSYDHRDRLLSEKTYLDNNLLGVVNYGYDSWGRLVKTTLGQGEIAITDSLKYNLQGWLSQRTYTLKDTPLFRMNLRYCNPELTDTHPVYSGSISEWEWQHGNEPSNTYAFAYDDLNRLENTRRNVADSNTTDNTFTESNLSYDMNGNLTGLSRYGTDSNYPDDGYTMLYEGNHLKTVYGSDVGDYKYNDAGNMNVDGLKGLKIRYNILNLPSSVIRKSSSGLLAHYNYLFDGTKLSVCDANDRGYEYIGSLTFERIGTDSLRFESTPFAGGRIVSMQTSEGLDYSTLYHLTDHLGSVRCVVDMAGNILERNNFYPFGKRWDEDNSTLSDNRYRFNGKEKQVVGNIGWLDFGARMYDPEIGRWFVPDPAAESSYSTSIYDYCLNNPVKFIDVNGKSPYYNRQGKLVRVDDAGFTGDIYIIEDNGDVKPIKQTFSLSLEAQSLLYTDVLNHMSDIDFSNLHNGKVSINTNRSRGRRITYNDPAEETQRYGTHKNSQGEIVVSSMENKYRNEMYNVEGIQNYLGVHEYKGHGLNGYSDKNKTHWKAYDDQLKHPTFDKMPLDLQKEVRDRRKEYMKEENPSLYKKIYGEDN